MGTPRKRGRGGRVESHHPPLKNKPIGRSGHALFTSALGRKPEEVVTSDLVAGGFPADVGEGGVNLAIPLVAAIEYVCSG